MLSHQSFHFGLFFLERSAMASNLFQKQNIHTPFVFLALFVTLLLITFLVGGQYNLAKSMILYLI